MITIQLTVRRRKWAHAYLWTMLILPLLFYACNKSEDNSQNAEITEKIQKLGNEGKTARENNQFDLAIDKHREELKFAESIGDSIAVVKALNNIATNYRRLGILDEAARYHYNALCITMRDERQTDKAVMKNHVISLNGLGNIYISLGDLDKADSILKVALEGEKKLGSKLGQAINLSNIGTVKEEQGMIDSAWIYYRHSLAINRQIQSKLGEALCFSHFASLHELEGNLQEASKEYQHTIDILADSPDDWHKLNAVLQLARLNLTQGKKKEALQLMEQGKSTALRIHSLEHCSQVYELYYKFYEKEGNSVAALENYKLSVQMKDSVIDSRKSEKIEDMRIRLDRQRQQEILDKANKRYLSERQARHIVTTILTIIIVVSVIVIGILWYTLRERIKTQKILQRMNKSKEDFFASLAIDPAEMQSANTIISERDRQFIGRFVDAVYSQMAKGKTDVESVAEQMELNRAQLNRRIQSITGQNTMAYITQIRISKAKRLLRADINTPIGDIATKCGFDDVAYFSRLFKQQTNMTPSQYRKML